MNVKWLVRSYLIICAIIGTWATYVGVYELALTCAVMGTIVVAS